MKIRTEVKINCEIDAVLEFVSNGENLQKWNTAVKQSAFKSEKDENTKIYSITRKLPHQVVENTLEITVNKSVNTIDMKTTSGPIPFDYHYKLVPFRGTTTVILNAVVDKEEVISLLGPKIKKVPKIMLKKMILKEINADLYSLKVDLEKLNNKDQNPRVV
jgi:hypothetical protein